MLLLPRNIFLLSIYTRLQYLRLKLTRGIKSKKNQFVFLVKLTQYLIYVFKFNDDAKNMQTCKADLYFYLLTKQTAISKEKKMKQQEIISLVYQKKKSINEKKSLRTKKVDKKIVN